MAGADTVIAHLQIKTLQAALRTKGSNLEEVNDECDDLAHQLNKVAKEKDAAADAAAEVGGALERRGPRRRTARQNTTAADQRASGIAHPSSSC